MHINVYEVYTPVCVNKWTLLYTFVHAQWNLYINRIPGTVYHLPVRVQRYIDV